jgi:4-amino-4-deoxy-L-arabinose transferase-like glycosyltransferase
MVKHRGGAYGAVWADVGAEQLSQHAERRWLVGIVAVYVTLALIYSLVVPPFEASDELWHYPTVQYLATHGLQLPPQEDAVNEAWRQEGSQPPLYYLMAALLTGNIDTSDLAHVRRVNPHADIGIVRPDRNANMIVHRPDENRAQGALLALQVARLFSVLLGAGTVAATFALGRALFPSRLEVAILAGGFNACLPMFLFISGSVNNDNLSNLLGSLLTLVLVRLLQREALPTLRDYALLGLLMGAGLLAKLNLGFFIPMIALALLIISARRRDWRTVIVGGVVSGGLTTAIAGWWYLRNWQLYDDPTGLNQFLSIVGRRAIPANAAQLWTERDSFLQSFWGFFGGMNVPMPTLVYTIFNVIGIVGMVSAVAYVVWRAARHEVTLAQSLTIAWIAITFLSFLRWTAETPASQGRLMFGAISSICVWLAVGWSWWLPQRWRRLAALPVAYTALIAVIAPFAFIRPMYAALPAPAVVPSGAIAVYGEDETALLQLDEAEVLTPQITPDSHVLIDTLWTAIAPPSRDWSLFVHLVTPDNVIVGQRDVYPSQGLWATSDLSAGQTWQNPIAIGLPTTAYAPMTLDVKVGWYHLPTGDRLTADDEELVTIGQVQVQPRQSAYDVPNPIGINFDNQIELVGYSLGDLSPAAGDETTLTLYWRALREISVDYTVFAQIIDPATTRIYAASNAMPSAYTRPTTTWQMGEIIEDVHTLTVDPTTPPFIYEVYVGLYTQDEAGGFNRLRVISADGGMAFNYAQLSRVRVLPVESEAR